MARFVPSGAVRPRKLRATDADRDAYADLVSTGYAEGQLDATTFEYRSSKVLGAETIGELDDLVADLITPETGSPVATLPTPAALTAIRRTSKIMLAVAAGVVVLIVGAVAVGISAGTESTAIQPAFSGVAVEVPPLDWAPEPSIDMYSRAGLQQVVDEIVAVAGSPQLTWLGLYGQYALATGPGAPGATRAADYDWRGGAVSTSPGSALEREEIFDVTTDVDLAAIADLARSAARQTGVVDPTSLYVSVDRSTFTADRQVEIRVNLSNDYQDGYITADHLGEIITIAGPGVEPDATRFFAASNIGTALEALGARLGHDEVTEVRCYGQYVAVEAPPEAGAAVVDGFEYRGGTFAAKQTYTPIQPDDVRAAVFSLAAIDGAVVAQAITDAPVSAGLPGADISFAYVQRPRKPAGHEPVIVVVISTDYASAEVIYGLDGALLQVS